MSNPNTRTGRRIIRLYELKGATESILTLSTISVQRVIHNSLAEGLINTNELHVLQSEWNGVQDHLESFIETISSILSAAKDVDRKERAFFANTGVRVDGNHPDNHDRDAGRVCPACDHDLELNADFQCARCGAKEYEEDNADWEHEDGPNDRD